MKTFHKVRLITTLTLCILSAPTVALVGTSLPGNTVGSITRQVEQNATQAAERAMEKRLESRARARANRTIKQLEELPDTLPVLTESGTEVFRDVALEDGFRAVESQWLVTGTESEIESLYQPGITVLERNELPNLGITLARFKVTTKLDSRKALETALPKLAGRLDRNHIYAPQSNGGASLPPAEVPQWQTLCRAPVRVGMVDTAIDTAHPAFARAQIVQERFLEIAEADSPLQTDNRHGTAVASLMVGQSNEQWPARLPGATLFNASVFYGRDPGLSGATLGHLLEGLNWLAAQELSAINISLTGPDNRLLKTAIRALKDRGVMLVAAVGNEGPSASPLYPAAYEDVVGVTAVDASGELYRWANQGEQVMFAGPGVSVPVASPGGNMEIDNGTSLAAPVITAALACKLADSPKEEAIAELISNARDLGEAGRDTRFGHGFVDM